jgi:hypothetical protein
MLSAESGMEFMRHVLSNVEIPANATREQIWAQLGQQVAMQINNTPNFGNATIAAPSAGSSSWTLPTLKLPGGGVCSVTLAPNDANATTVDVTVQGVEADLRIDKTQGTAPNQRKIRLTFVKGPRASEIFDYGVASRSAINMGGNAVITGTAGSLERGSVLSATSNPVPLVMTGSPKISGDFSYTNPSGAPSFGNGTIAGYSSSSSEFANHVHAGVSPPEFPSIDTSPFEQYVPNASASGPSVISASPPSTRKSFTNIRIKAGVNPSFSSGSVIQGVVFIETPNQIRFTGGVTIQGVIVVQNNPTGDVTTNSIHFGGNVTHQGVETLPNSGAFEGLPNLSGSFLLAPKFNLVLRGNSNNVGGTIVAGKIDIAGTAGANVKGSVINLEDTALDMTGTSDIVISPSGSDKYPAGITFGSHFTANPATYMELQ